MMSILTATTNDLATTFLEASGLRTVELQALRVRDVTTSCTGTVWIRVADLNHSHSQERFVPVLASRKQAVLAALKGRGQGALLFPHLGSTPPEDEQARRTRYARALYHELVELLCGNEGVDLLDSYEDAVFAVANALGEKFEVVMDAYLGLSEKRLSVFA